MPFANTGKGDQIRALQIEGLSAPEIIARGYRRTTVYRSLKRDRAKRSIERVLEDVLSLQTETIRLLRKMLDEAGPLE